MAPLFHKCSRREGVSRHIVVEGQRTALIMLSVVAAPPILHISGQQGFRVSGDFTRHLDCVRACI